MPYASSATSITGVVVIERNERIAILGAFELRISNGDQRPNAGYQYAPLSPFLQELTLLPMAKIGTPVIIMDLYSNGVRVATWTRKSSLDAEMDTRKRKDQILGELIAEYQAGHYSQGIEACLDR